MPRCRVLAEVGRRQFLRGGAASAAAAAVATVAPDGEARAATTAAARVSYPSSRLANLADLKDNLPLEVAYPDADAPGVLLKLGRAVPGGVGPDDDVVGFTTVCPHKGGFISEAQRAKRSGSGRPCQAPRAAPGRA
jgi:arsenite oxidase small subunit